MNLEQLSKDKIIKKAVEEINNLPIKSSKAELIKLLVVVTAIDLGLTVFDITGFIASFGMNIVVEEILELVMSGLLARNKVELTWTDKAVGLLPIPGVTALGFRAVKELIKLRKNK